MTNETEPSATNEAYYLALYKEADAERKKFQGRYVSLYNSVEAVLILTDLFNSAPINSIRSLLKSAIEER